MVEIECVWGLSACVREKPSETDSKWDRVRRREQEKVSECAKVRKSKREQEQERDRASEIERVGRKGRGEREWGREGAKWVLKSRNHSRRIRISHLCAHARACTHTHTHTQI